MRPEAFKVGVDLFGISNWVCTLESIPPWWASFREALYVELGNPKTDAARLRRISPLFNADKMKPCPSSANTTYSTGTPFFRAAATISSDSTLSMRGRSLPEAP